jgi:multiple sugar transport system substrate-binding protein
MPSAASAVDGQPTAALGGAQLAVNAHSRHPEAALRVVRFLTEPEQMLERAQALGQFPSRPDLYDDPRLRTALAIDPEQARTIIERARPRPVTPVYSELSGILQIWVHRALSGQEEPERALARAAEEITRLLERVELGPGAAAGRER